MRGMAFLLCLDESLLAMADSHKDVLKGIIVERHCFVSQFVLSHAVAFDSLIILLVKRFPINGMDFVAVPNSYYSLGFGPKVEKSGLWDKANLYIIYIMFS